jgi:Domain of unknown function (DUF4760)
MPNGKQITITIPSFTISRSGALAIFAVTAGLIAAYIWGPRAWHDTLIFAATVLASAALLLTAADSLDSHGSEKAMAQKVAAMKAIERWNSPQFYHCKKNGREVQAYFKAHPAIGDQLTYLDSSPELRANLMDVLNHFEALAIGIANRIVDDEIAKDFFCSMALQYWHHSEAYIRNRRAEQNNTRLFDNFEALFERWKD